MRTEIGEKTDSSNRDRLQVLWLFYMDPFPRIGAFPETPLGLRRNIVMTENKWRMSKHPLYRGDRKSGVTVPNPEADGSIVRHILFLEGPGRETPYLSTSEEYETANNFATGGAVWETYVKQAIAEGISHISRAELLSLMKGYGKGKAKWDSAFEVMQARRYVEQWNEHLFDFTDISSPETITKKIFKKS